MLPGVGLELDARPIVYRDNARCVATRRTARAAYFVLGWSLYTLVHWRRPEDIIRLARLVVVTRPGFEADWEALERAIPGLRGATDVIDTVRLDISSTELREQVRQGMPSRYLVPAPVEVYIREHRLYAGEGDAP